MRQLFFVSLLCFPLFLFGQSVDSTLIRQIDSLLQVSRDLTKSNDFDQALAINEKAEKLALDYYGRVSAAYGNCCMNHGRILYNQRAYPAAEKWYTDSKDILENSVGTKHPDYASSLYYLGVLYSAIGQYEKAEPHLLEAKSIRERSLGKEHQDYGWSLSSLGLLFNRVGNFEKAEQHYAASLAIFEKIHGKGHTYYASNLNNLASVYMRQGKFDDAETLFLESIETTKTTIGKADPDYAGALINLGNLYRLTGQFELAAPLFTEALDIFQNLLNNTNHPFYSICLSSLADLYRLMGKYEKAEPLYIESKKIREKKLGKNHPDYAVILNGQGTMYGDIGQFDKAELLYTEARDIYEKTLGKEHPYYAGMIYNLASLFLKTGQYEKAEPLFIEAKDIREKTVGKEHSDYASSLVSLGAMYVNSGEYDAVGDLFLQAGSIMEKTLGKENFSYINTISHQASLSQKTGHYQKAENQYLEALGLLEKIIEKEHPEYVQSLENLVSLFIEMGEYEKAEPLIEDLSSLNRSLISKAQLHLSEREMQNYINQFLEKQHQLLSFTHAVKGQKLSSVSYDNSLFYKGFLLNAANQVKRLAQTNASSAEKYNLLKSCQRRLAAQYSLPLLERDSASIEELEARINAIEKELTRTVAGFGEALQQVKWSEVQAALQPGEAAIEFVHFRYFEKEESDSTLYAALLIRPGDSLPKYIPLFEEKSLDSLLASDNGRKADYVNALYSKSDRGAQSIGQKKRTIHELIWMPLQGELEGFQKIFFSSTGLLHRINIGAIPVSDGETLADLYQLIELSSTRQLVIPAKVELAAQDAVLYGGVQFEMDSLAIIAANTCFDTESIASRGELSFKNTNSTSRGGSWNYLQWTEKEVNNLESILENADVQSTSRKGYNATEESFKTIGVEGPSPRFLHIATHGFFFPDPTMKSNGSENEATTEPIFKLSEHPMIRSGLMMAGGNYAWQTGKPLMTNMDDGILTAYEISQMNLSNTELVVLSACETGLGDIQGNEGVYGLQRAFKIAGAKYLIMSLWQVPDKETAYFMGLFYRHLTEGSMSIPEAFHATQKELRENPFASPYDWAGFVLVE